MHDGIADQQPIEISLPSGVTDIQLADVENRF
jgi:hypothetical protein